MNKYWYNKTQRGYIALISVLIIGAVGMAITVSLLVLGIGNARTSFALVQSSQAKALAGACAEEALQEIRDNTAYTGSQTSSIGQGLCTYTVTDQGQQNRRVEASGSVDATIRKIEINITNINPAIEIDSWEEVDSF